jgi:hypothetical protein
VIKLYFSRFHYLSFIGMALLLASCTPGKNVPTASTNRVSQTPNITVTETSLPTLSATKLPDLVLLVAPSGANPDLTGKTSTILAGKASKEGFRFETRTSLVEPDLSADVRLVVVLAPDPGLATIVPSHPEIQFLALGIPGLQTSNNLSLIAPQGDRFDRYGFLAGYISAVITKDWRVGVISRMDMPAGLAAQNAFTQGVIFYCGLCSPVYPPYYKYPLFAGLAGGASQAEQEAAADTLLNNGIQTVYVFPDAGDVTLLEYLAKSSANLIGGVLPPSGMENQWVATIQTDVSSAIEQAWPGIISGHGGMSVELPIILTNVNSNLISSGRQRLVEKILADLMAGYIDTGVDPLTGELR